jgi:predicted esterase
MPVILSRRLFLIVILCAAILSTTISAPQATFAQDIPRLPTCDDEPDAMCEVIRDWDIDELASISQNLTLDGDTLILFYESADARVVLVAGDFQVALRWIPDTDYFALAVRMPRLREAILTYAFVPITDDGYDQSDLQTTVWRGPDGDPAPATNNPLQGTVETHTLDSRALNEQRGLTIYLPPDHDPAIETPVVYLSDGQGVRTFATSIDHLITEGQIAPIILVGMDARVPDQDVDEPRAAEYLLGFDDLRFAAHEQFFIEEVIPFAEATYGASTDRDHRMVYGLSNGAAFSISMGMRHPDLFSRVAASSFGWGLDYDVADDAPPVAYYLSAGTIETHFHRSTVEWYELLLEKGIDVTFHEIVADHNFPNFFTEFTNAALWAFAIEE